MDSKVSVNNFLKKVVYCELLSRTGFSNEQVYRKNIIHLTSMVSSSRKTKSISHKEFISSIFHLFSHWVNVWLIVLILLLLTIGGSTGYIAWNYFNQQKNSPRLNHLIVSGNLDKDLKIEPKVLTSFQSVPWQKGKGRNDNSKRTQVNAYGRVSGGIKSIVLGSNNKADTRKKWDVYLLSANYAEPIFKTIPLFLGENLSSLKPTGKTISDYKSREPSKSIILSRSLMERILKNDKEKIPEYIWINLFNKYVKMKLVGLTDYLPEDRYYVFNGLIGTPDYINSLVSNDSSADDYVNYNGDLKTYERAVIYFDYKNFENLSKFLDEKGYLFNRDNFKKIGEMNKLANIVLSIFIIMISVIFLLAIFLMRNTFSLYIRENNLSLAVMKAAGAEFNIFKKLVNSLVTYDCFISIIIGGAILFLINIIIIYFNLSSVVNTEIYQVTSFFFIFCSFCILGIGRFSVLKLLNSWWKKNQYPANSLRSN